ncbi:MAG: phosphopantothenate/pantothenate synthetase [Methanomassiliicoccales archaeon]|nr:phosphopantothenate/pantothenate synthetase [Methanomassiliicoccales archaeon]
MKISEDHPRYRSLITRERMAAMVGEGVVSTTGLIAHGRGEAFDYLLGERTVPEAESAERAAAAFLVLAERPVITVNGNAAALAARDLGELSRASGAPLEVNLFHRSDERVEKVCAFVERESGEKVLGRQQDGILEGIASDRARCTRKGLLAADVVLIPLEDGDRAEAMVRAGKKVISIDLNPLSRTSLTATVAVVDEITRAVPNIIAQVKRFKNDQEEAHRVLTAFDNRRNLNAVLDRICHELKEKGSARTEG